MNPRWRSRFSEIGTDRYRASASLGVRLAPIRFAVLQYCAIRAFQTCYNNRARRHEKLTRSLKKGRAAVAQRRKPSASELDSCTILAGDNAQTGFSSKTAMI